MKILVDSSNSKSVSSNYKQLKMVAENLDWSVYSEIYENVASQLVNNSEHIINNCWIRIDTKTSEFQEDLCLKIERTGSLLDFLQQYYLCSSRFACFSFKNIFFLVLMYTSRFNSKFISKILETN